MKRLLTTIALLLAAGCATNAPVPPAAAAPEGEARFLVDPRIAYDQPADPATARRFETAWRFFSAGDYAEAQKVIGQLLASNPNYAPASLLTAAIDLRSGRIDEAGTLVEKIQEKSPAYTAANVYAAEIALARHSTRAAYQLYQSIAAQPNAPATAAERVAAIRTQLFSELFGAAQSSPEAQAIPMLREALQIEPGAVAARILLVQKLIAQKNYDDARRELDPILSGNDLDRPDVQEALAEIEVGRGRYQEAIVRYDRLARRSNEPRYTERLNAIKEQFAAANMPPQYQRALESEAMTRADFAVLLFWKVPSIRFAQNAGVPAIAVDLDSDVVGREEMIRAIALGIFPVDQITRRAAPSTPLTAATAARAAARALTSRAAACAKSNDAQTVLAACGVNDPLVGSAPEGPVSGRAGAAMAGQIDKALSR